MNEVATIADLKNWKECQIDGKTIQGVYLFIYKGVPHTTNLTQEQALAKVSDPNSKFPPTKSGGSLWVSNSLAESMDMAYFKSKVTPRVERPRVSDMLANMQIVNGNYVD